MRLYSLSVLYKGDPKVHLLKAAYDVSTFNFFQRSRWVLVAGTSGGELLMCAVGWYMAQAGPWGQGAEAFERFFAPLELQWQAVKGFSVKQNIAPELLPGEL